jgi:hypothetical protein
MYRTPPRQPAPQALAPSHDALARLLPFAVRYLNRLQWEDRMGRLPDDGADEARTLSAAIDNARAALALPPFPAK